MMAEWERLVNTTIRDYVENHAEDLRSKLELLDRLTPPEKRERLRKHWEAEQARLSAIEAAKPPAQKLREKQAACVHDFSNRNVCRLCKLKATAGFVRGYQDGYDKGHDAGRESYEE